MVIQGQSALKWRSDPLVCTWGFWHSLLQVVSSNSHLHACCSLGSSWGGVVLTQRISSGDKSTSLSQTSIIARLFCPDTFASGYEASVSCQRLSSQWQTDRERAAPGSECLCSDCHYWLTHGSALRWTCLRCGIFHATGLSLKTYCLCLCLLFVRQHCLKHHPRFLFFFGSLDNMRKNNVVLFSCCNPTVTVKGKGCSLHCMWAAKLLSVKTSLELSWWAV